MDLLNGSEIRFLKESSWSEGYGILFKTVLELSHLNEVERDIYTRSIQDIVEVMPELKKQVKTESHIGGVDFDVHLQNISRSSPFDKYKYTSTWNNSPIEPSFGLKEKQEWCIALKEQIQKSFAGVTPKDTIFSDVYKVVSRDLKDSGKYTLLHRTTFSEFINYWNSSEFVEFKLPDNIEVIRLKYSEIDYANHETKLSIEEFEYNTLKEYYNNNKGNIPIEELLKKELRNNKKVSNSVFIKMLIWLDEYVELKNIKKEINYGF